MPRPNKLRVPTKTLNVILTEKQYNWLKKTASDKSRFLNQSISMSDIIRELLWFRMRKGGE